VSVGVRGCLEAEEFVAEGAGIDFEWAGRWGAVGESEGEEVVVVAGW